MSAKRAMESLTKPGKVWATMFSFGTFLEGNSKPAKSSVQVHVPSSQGGNCEIYVLDVKYDVL